MLNWRILSLAVVGVGFSVASARADSILLYSFGTWGTAGANQILQSETLLYPPSTTGSFPALTTLSSLDTFAPLQFLTGVATYADGTGDSLLLNLTFTNTQNVGSSAVSADGTWLYAGGTGQYASSFVAGGAGTFSVSFSNGQNGATSGFSGTTLLGDLSPAPEPASMTLLGLGIAGLVARRRKR